MDDDDYRRLTDCIFYEIFEDGTIDAFMFHRHRWDDSVHRYSGPIPEYLHGGQCTLDELFRCEESRSDTIRKEETEEMIEQFLPGSVHYPFGCLTEPFQPGRYWMYADERDITNPVPPLNDRLGVIDWIIHVDSEGMEERFSGDFLQAIRRFREVDIHETVMMIDRIFFVDDDTDDDSEQTKRCYLTSDRFPDVEFTLGTFGLIAHRGDERLFHTSPDSLDHFIQKDQDDP